MGAQYFCEDESKFQVHDATSVFCTLCDKISEARKENEIRKKREERQKKMEEEKRQQQEKQEKAASQGVDVRNKNISGSDNVESGCIVDVLLAGIRAGDFSQRSGRVTDASERRTRRRPKVSRDRLGMNRDR